MGKSALFATFLFGVVLSLTGSSHGDVASTQTAPTLPAGDAVAEPITGTPVTPNPGDESVQKDPFALYDVGPPGTKTWSYNDLTATEKAWADKNADTTGWDQIHSAYASAVQEQAQQAAAASAASQLGVDTLAGTGVVP